MVLFASIPLDVALELKGQKGVDETELDQIIEALRRFAESCAHYEEEVAVATMGDAPRNVIGTGAHVLSGERGVVGGVHQVTGGHGCASLVIATCRDLPLISCRTHGLTR